MVCEGGDAGCGGAEGGRGEYIDSGFLWGKFFFFFQPASILQTRLLPPSFIFLAPVACILHAALACIKNPLRHSLPKLAWK